MKPLEVELQEVKRDPRFEVDDKGSHLNPKVIDLIIYRSKIKSFSPLSVLRNKWHNKLS